MVDDHRGGQCINRQVLEHRIGWMGWSDLSALNKFPPNDRFLFANARMKRDEEKSCITQYSDILRNTSIIKLPIKSRRRSRFRIGEIGKFFTTKNARFWTFYKRILRPSKPTFRRENNIHFLWDEVTETEQPNISVMFP